MSRPWGPCLLLLLFIAHSRQLSITELVVPYAVAAGSDAELQCWFSQNEPVDYVKWWWTPLYAASGVSDRVQIYQRLTDLKSDVMHKHVVWKGNDTIVLLDTEANYSGIYECEVSRGDIEIRKHNNLIVFSNGTDMHLNVTSVEDGPDADADDDVLIQCEAHDVTPLPELSISVNGKTIEKLSPFIIDKVDGLYDIYVNATVSSDNADDAEIRCELFYEDENINHPQYVQTITYTTGAARSTTAAPEDTTLSEVASELQNTNGGADLHGKLWTLIVAAVLQFYVF